MSLYPLLFEPRFVEKIWGGRKLEAVLGKTLPPEKSIGESWEIYDFPPGVVDSSEQWVSATVSNGPLRGKTLHSLVVEYGKDLLGTTSTSGALGQFPILIKYLDAREDLSVQVHPDQTYADQNPGAHLKTEAWYVLQSDAASRLLKGLVPGSTPETFTGAIQAGEVEQHIQQVPVKAGECYFLPSGTVHALGAGILVAEVQTPSDTTFRVYDFNRVEPATGKPRKLHVDQAMACIDFSGNPEPEQQRSHVAGPHTTVSRLVTCPYFILEKVRFSEGVQQPVPYNEPVLWMMLEGSAEIKVADHPQPTRVKKGDTVLLPASMKNPVLKTLTDCVWLEVTFPTS